MDILTILSFVVGIVSLFYAIISYVNNKSSKERLKEVSALTESLINITKKIKTINNTELSFELEREVRRMSLFLNNDNLINTSLLWFIENGNSQDKEIIERAIKNKCLKNKKNIKYAEEAIKNIIFKTLLKYKGEDMILFIDDELMFNESYKEALEEAGFSVYFEQDVQKAVQFFRDKMEQIKLVILDIMMPLPEELTISIDKSKTQNGMRTGEEVLSLLNETEKGKSITKIILTNVSDQEFLTKYSSSDEVAGIYRKRETLPSELVTLAKTLINLSSR